MPPALRSALVLFLAGLSSLPGQDQPFRYNGSAYATIGIGRCQHRVTNVSVGGGGDAFLWRGLALGGDLGYFRFAEESGFGIATLNTGYHFTRRTEPGRFDPFVSAGLLGVAFSGRARSPAASLGGGMTYWLARRVGLRFEGRVYGVADEVIGMFRMGVSFR